MQILLLLSSYLTISFTLKNIYIYLIAAARKLYRNPIIYLALELKLEKRLIRYQKKDLLGLIIQLIDKK